MTAAAAALPPSLSSRLSTYFYLRPRMLLALFLLPPLLWLGIVYLGSLFALLAQSFFQVDDFTGKVVYQPVCRGCRHSSRRMPASTPAS